jgi:hypothetical protein
MKIIILVCCLLVAAIAFADVKLVQKVKSDGILGQKASDGTVTIYVKNGKARIENTTAGGYSVVDVAAGKVSMVNPAKKEVMVMTAEQIKQATGLVSQLMGNKSAAPPSVQKLGTSKTYNGYKCDEYKVVTSTPFQSTGVYCAAPEIDLNKEMLPFMELSKELSQMFGGETMKSITGYPVHSDSTTSIMGQTMKSTTDLISVSRDAQPDSLFEVPADYTVKAAPIPNINQ